ncbi:Arylsulfatase A [Hydrobacter penzbergensis]|uniref:Arylsulfatase A n=1 Tax=Hydrobacter penzbergensis TaxID=1235997 RepID=A0A8X8IG05_9BACT|nr:sulfatase [Hydrobacter penzbergensis]SDX19446.1 Arylsulfatase A [Hydrobacter penzbergensis]
MKTGMLLRRIFTGWLCAICTNVFSQSPNIILIIGDDISRDDIGIYGRNPFIHTPNIDEINKDGGVRFDHFFVTSSSCSPSRSSLITGRYPHNTGAAELHTPLPASQVFFPELLKKNGYFTALLGKWHEGSNTSRAYDTLITGVALNGDGGEDQWIPMLQNRPKDKPFFFWLASFDAHRPWGADTSFPHAVENIQVPATLVDSISTRKDLASYYSEIERLDYFVGKLVNELKAQHIYDNTVIIFIGDNGRPFPGDKTRLYDRGTNTPFVMRVPWIKPQKQTMDCLVSAIDVAPTLLELAHVETGASSIQGHSLLNLLHSGKDEFRNYIFTEHNWHDYQAYERAIRTRDYLFIQNKLFRLSNQGPLDAVTSPSFRDLLNAKSGQKLTALQDDIFIAPRSSEELYDIRKDPLQSHNLIHDLHYSKIAVQLRQVLQQWEKETSDDFPANLTPDWYHRISGDSLSAKGVRGIMPGSHSNAIRNNHKGVF